MTEFEMASLHIELTNNVGVQFTTFFTVISAFMVSSYVAAHRLTLTMAAIGLGLFTLTCLISILASSIVLTRWLALSDEIQKFAEAGNGLTWHTVAGTQTFKGPAVTIFISVSVLMSTAAIYFFFHCRRVNRVVGA